MRILVVFPAAELGVLEVPSRVEVEAERIARAAEGRWAARAAAGDVRAQDACQRALERVARLLLADAAARRRMAA